MSARETEKKNKAMTYRTRALILLIGFVLIGAVVLALLEQSTMFLSSADNPPKMTPTASSGRHFVGSLHDLD